MVANLSEAQKKFGSRLSMVNGKLMFAYLESECTLKDFKFTEEDGKMYPKSWANALERLEQKGVIQSYIVGKIDNVNTALVFGFNPNAEFHKQSRENIANYYLDINGKEQLPSDEFKFERKHKERQKAA